MPKEGGKIKRKKGDLELEVVPFSQPKGVSLSLPPASPLMDIPIGQEELTQYVAQEEQLLELAKAGFFQQLDSGAIRAMINRRGLSDLKVLDEMLRLRRGQATANFGIAHFDVPIQGLIEKIRELEMEYKNLTGKEVVNDGEGIRECRSEVKEKGVKEEEKVKEEKGGVEIDAVRNQKNEGRMEGLQPERGEIEKTGLETKSSGTAKSDLCQLQTGQIKKGDEGKKEEIVQLEWMKLKDRSVAV